MSLETLAEISCYYGKNSDYVLAGGGNTSWKDEETLYIKGSGMSLADVVPDSFVRMDRKALAEIWNKNYPESSVERESAVLADMMAARKSGEEQKRPSVETLLHDLMPFAYVVHLHPALVNGLTCSKRGEKAMTEIFADEAIWIPLVSPGYILSKKVKIAMDAYSQKNNKPPAIIFLQNHGIFVGDNHTDNIKGIYDNVMNKIGALIKRRPDFSDEKQETNSAQIGEIERTLQELSGGKTAFMQSREIAALVKNRASFAPISSAFSPDHIVYAGSDPLFIEAGTDAGIRSAWNDHIRKTGRNPKITAIQGLGVFGVAASEKAALLALDLFKDSIKVAIFSEPFGGPQFMSQDLIEFINNWEVELFRAQQFGI
jgi:rhamnose utilization protein RhaD (predicted bifunctional aldolase and dehydrogenase)